MIRLGLRLTFGSGRESARRVAVMAAAVALGVGLLLVVLAGMNGLRAQADRGAWLNTSQKTAPQSFNGSTAGPLWWLHTIDQFGAEPIDQVDVAPAGSNAPVPPGIPRLPGPGEFYVSPALTRLLRSLPADQLRDRYPGHQIGTIGAAALPSPNSLIIVIGHDASQLSHVQGAVEVRGIQRSLADCYACQSSVGSGPVLEWILAGCAVALLLPVLILIGTASRLSAARREERFAAMRLVGATPRQISVIAAEEAVIASLVGVAVGFAFFFIFRPLLYRVPFTGTPLSQGDLSLHGIEATFVAIVVPIAAAASAVLTLRRVRVSPLGVTRRARSAPPRLIRLVPLLAGIGLLAYFDAAGKPPTNSGQLLELLVAFVLLTVGLVLAGSWFTTAGSRLMANRGNRPAALIAGRRLLDNPKAAFRFVSGLVIALFVTSALVGALSSVAAFSNTSGGNAQKETLADTFACYSVSPCPASAEVAAIPARALDAIRGTPGVRGVTVVHQNPNMNQQFNGFELVACDQLARTPAIGKCKAGASVATLGRFLNNVLGAKSNASSTVWPTAARSVGDITRLPVDAVVVATDGTAASIERARTVLERSFPFQGTAVTVESLDPPTARLLTMIQNLTDVIIVASLIIAACSLAVNIVAGLGERKRPFSLLRLTGVPTAVLRRVITLESALPLLIVAIVAIAVGLTAAALYLSSQVGIAFRVPGLGYWVTVLGGLAASLAIIVSTFPILDRITGPEVARNE
jgi:FtsX-like permease family